MFIDNSLAAKRVDDEDNLINLVLSLSSNSNSNSRSLIPVKDAELVGIVKPHHEGRPKGSDDVPMEIRVAAGLLAQTDKVKDIAAALGINHDTVLKAKHGQSTFGVENTELKQRLDNSLSIVRDKALERLLSSLDLLDDEKISKANAKDISSISANMAKTLTMTLPKEATTQINAQLIVYAPSQTTEAHFEVVEI